MSAFKDLAKGGWHPGGKKESTPSYSSSTSDSGWRNKFKGADTVAGWVGRPGKDNYRDRYENHQSTPLGALKDPDAFGPPPKRYGAGGSSSSEVTQVETGLGSSSLRREAPPTPTRPKPGSMRAQADEEAAAQEEPPMRRGPFQLNTTGLDTSHLPAPPVRRGDMALPTQPSLSASAVQTSTPKVPPKLPPRLPPRQAIPMQPPPSYETATEQELSSAARPTGLLNTAAVDRLGKAGVTVPGLGIGQGRATPAIPSRLGANPIGKANDQVADDQAGSPASSGGTTWAQKRAALETAQKMRQDPSSVSFSELRSSATTANNFRERHGEQIASGLKYANQLNAQYGDAQSSEGAAHAQGASLPFRKPAVPLPLGSKAPPPIPHGTKPNLG